MSRQEQYFAIYQKASQNIKNNLGTLEDELIVSLWDSVKSLQKTNATQAHKISLLEVGEVEVTQEVKGLLSRY